jgi:hypothetical protein
MTARHRSAIVLIDIENPPLDPAIIRGIQFRQFTSVKG